MIDKDDDTTESQPNAMPSRAIVVSRGRRLVRHALVFITLVIVVDAIARAAPGAPRVFGARAIARAIAHRKRRAARDGATPA